MPTTPKNGWLFGDEYRDGRTAEQRAEDQRKVSRQVAYLSKQQPDDGYHLELLVALRRRRAGRDDTTQFDLLVRDREPLLVVRGELVARSDIFDDPGVEEFLAPYKFKRIPVECLDNRVVRLATADIDPEQLARIAALLRSRGHDVGMNYVTPLGPVAKARGGPEPTQVADLTYTGETDADVVVAVIDTGIADQHRKDGWLENVERTDNLDPLDAFPAGGDGKLDFAAGHGTFAAGVIQQVASAAQIKIYRGLDSDGIGSQVDVACAMVDAVREGARILNLSLGTHTANDLPPVALTVALELIGELERQQEREVLVVAAAGNDGATRPSWPAAYRRVVAVAGLTPERTPADWSNHGFWVDCSTVAEGVVSTYVEGDESPEVDPEQPDHFGPDTWATWTGTSFAAPQVVGAVARLCHEDKTLTPRRALVELLRKGYPIPEYGIAMPILHGT